MDAGNDTLATEASSNLYKQHIPNPSSQDKDTGISQDDCSDASLAIKVRTAAQHLLLFSIVQGTRESFASDMVR